MNDNVKPSTIALIAGGAVLFISTFFAWFSVDTGFGTFSENGISTDGGPGLLGVWCLIIGAAVAAGVAATTFANVSLPDRIVGFTREQVYLILGFAAFLITFGRVFAGDTGIGLWLGVLGSAAIVVGAFMEQNEGAGTSSPPTQF